MPPIPSIQFNRGASPSIVRDTLYRKAWNVYAKAPFDGPQRTLEYLGRYTHRVAISNNRILSVDNGTIRFTYRDRRDGDRIKIMVGVRVFNCKPNQATLHNVRP